MNSIKVLLWILNTWGQTYKEILEYILLTLFCKLDYFIATLKNIEKVWVNLLQKKVL